MSGRTRTRRRSTTERDSDDEDEVRGDAGAGDVSAAVPKNGAEAHASGFSVDDCPFEDSRKDVETDHDWVPSTYGHGETMCRLCMATNREAAVLKMVRCRAPSANLRIRWMREFVGASNTARKIDDER